MGITYPDVFYINCYWHWRSKFVILLRFCKRSLLRNSLDPDLIDKIPGRQNDRRTPLGELNWIFTAITDTIAWNVLPRGIVRNFLQVWRHICFWSFNCIQNFQSFFNGFSGKIFLLQAYSGTFCLPKGSCEQQIVVHNHILAYLQLISIICGRCTSIFM